MSRIHILSESVITKIAAGEVVARPASVVKELVDNAIDAGASTIEIDISGGGKKHIVVIDNGCGMDEKDTRLSIERHATSKITTENDLTTIKTMGFRGEALAAIASVSKLKIETKPKDSSIIEGTLLVTEGGEIKEIRSAGCPAGTKITISDLFFNTPARKKFLRSDSSEYGHITDTIISLALANPDIRFELSNEGAPKLGYLRTGDILNRIEDVLGKDSRDNLAWFEETSEEITIKGYISLPGFTRGSPKDFHFFLNGRPVRDRIIQHAVTAGFGTSLAKGSYPIAVLHININPQLVDVNVHPTKNEVRFENTSMIHDFVMSSVRKSISKTTIAMPVYAKISDWSLPSQSKSNYSLSPCGRGLGRGKKTSDFTSPLPLTPSHKGEGEFEQQIAMTGFTTDDRRPTTDDFGFHIIGQFDNAFILCEDRDSNLILVDQHAAHERLGFEELKRQFASGSVEQQMLLLPEQITLTPKEFATIEGHLDKISRAGFDLEPFGGTSVMVKALPSMLGDIAIKPLLEKISAELADFGSSQISEDETDKIFAVIACHRQIRAGDSLTREEQEHLVREIEKFNISACPHGRPAVVKLGRTEIEKWFKR